MTSRQAPAVVEEAAASADRVAAPGRARAILGRLRNPYAAIWPATVLLFAVSPLIAPGSLRATSLQSTIPFAALLGIVAIGQTLVIQQRGLDLSAPGAVSLAAILVTRIPGAHSGSLALGVLVAIAACVAAGLLSGLAVTILGITPLVATLAVNALLLGTILQITSGSSTTTAQPGLTDFASHRVVGFAAIVWIALFLAIVVGAVNRSTVVGRRFTMIGTSPSAARAAGYAVKRYELLTYCAAGLFYALAGVLLAGYLHTPGLSAGNNYLLSSIAAVVLGGTSLAGGAGSAIGTLGGALFLTQLQQDVFGAGAPTSVQLIIQATAIGVGMAIRTVPWRRLFSRNTERVISSTGGK
ncbi:MAG: inner-rane translocator [Frankiales bacterium]|nr:inner-rane translocator [Frankiales bacterium]